MSEVNHTPTPWQIEGKYAGDSGSLYLSTMHPMPVFELVPVVGVEAEHVANADFIVTAVNSYDKQRVLIGNMIRVMASLAAAISLLERSPKTAAPSDKMFDQMLDDYRNDLETARAAIAAIKEQSQ